MAKPRAKQVTKNRTAVKAKAATKPRTAASKRVAAKPAAKKSRPPGKGKPIVLEPLLIGATGLRQASGINALAVSRDGSLIATGDGDGVVRVFDRATNACVFETKWIARDHRGRHGIQRLAFSPDGSVITALTGIIGHGNLCAAHVPTKTTWFETSDVYYSYAFSRDGSQLAAVKSSGRLEIVNARDGTATTTIARPDTISLDEVAWSADGAWIVASYWDQATSDKSSLMVVDAETLEVKSQHAIGVSFAGAQLGFDASATLVTVIESWSEPPAPRVVRFDPVTGKHDVRPVEGALGDDSLHGEVLVERGAALLLRDVAHVVDLAEARVVRTLPSDTRHAVASGDGELVVSSHGVALRVWDRAWNEVSSTPGLSTVVRSIGFSSDGVVTCDETGIRTWRLDGAFVAQLVAGSAHALTADARMALVVGDKRTVVVELPSGQPRPGGVNEEWNYAALSADGRWLGVRNYTDAKGRIQMWSAESGALVRTLDVSPGSSTYGVAFSPDGTLIAGGSWDFRLAVFDVASGAGVATGYVSQSYGVGAFSFAHDNTMLASGDQRRTVRLWKLPSGKLAHTLKGHRRSVITATAFSRDGALLASADEADVRVWNVRTGEALAVARVGADCLAFSPDGTRLAAGGSGVAYLFDVGSL